MSVFISFNFETGFCAAMNIAAKLMQVGEDCWWFPEPIGHSYIDDAVETAMSNCNRCVLVWSKADLSEWQHFELSRIRDHLVKRSPSGDPTDMFLVLRNLADQSIMEKSTLPLLSNCEYLDYMGLINMQDQCSFLHSHQREKTAPLCARNPEHDCPHSDRLDLPDLTPLAGHAPSIHPLVYFGARRPVFYGNKDFKPSQGRQVLVGGYEEMADEPQKVPLNCWVLLEDSWGQKYIQQPRPTITHAKRWIATNVHLGPNIQAIILAAMGPTSHRMMINKVLRKEWGAISDNELPSDYNEIDRLGFSST